MGVLDLPSPLFTGIDALLADALPPIGRLALWGAAAAVLSMEVYRRLSPQTRIAMLRSELRQAQRVLAAYDGDFGGARPLMSRVLATAFSRIALVAPAALAASLPVLCLLTWLDTHYDRRFPEPGETVQPHAVPERFHAAWFPNETAQGGYFVVTGRGGQPVFEMSIPVPVDAVRKYQWWNVLVGSPVSYLPSSAPVEEVHLDFPRKEVVAMGPHWLRTWEPPFFGALLACALAMKWFRRIA